jgi:hypothetical protein
MKISWAEGFSRVLCALALCSVAWATGVEPASAQFVYSDSTDPTGVPDLTQWDQPICGAAAAIDCYWNWSSVAPFNGAGQGRQPLFTHRNMNDFAVNWGNDAIGEVSAMADIVYGPLLNNGRTKGKGTYLGMAKFANYRNQLYNKNNYPNGLSFESLMDDKVKYSVLKDLVTNHTGVAILSIGWFKANDTLCEGGECSASCAADANCPAGRCSNNPALSCRGNGDCQNGGLCNNPAPQTCVGGKCSGHSFCAADADCPAGGCSNNPGLSCRENGDCQNGLCNNPAPYTCTDLSTDAHAVTVAGVDDTNKKIAISNPWGDHAHCSASCAADADCPDGSCSNDPDRGCRTNNDCQNGGTCTNPAPQTCIQGTCSVPINTSCAFDADCPGKLACMGGLCTCSSDVQCPAGACSNPPGLSCRANGDCQNGGTCTNPRPQKCPRPVAAGYYDVYTLDAAALATDTIRINATGAGNADFVGELNTVSQTCTTIRTHALYKTKKGGSPAVTATVVDHPSSQTLTYTVHNPDSAEGIYHVYLILNPLAIDISQARAAASSWLASHQPSWQVAELDPNTGPDAAFFSVTGLNDPHLTPAYHLGSWTCDARGLHYSTTSASVGLGSTLTLGFDMPGLRNQEYWDDVYIVANQTRDHGWSGVTLGTAATVAVPALTAWGILALVLLLAISAFIAIRVKWAHQPVS